MISGVPVTKQFLESIYAKLKPAWFVLNPVCHVPGCGKVTKDLHHQRGRTGLLVIVAEYFSPLCRPHHDRLKQPGGVAWGRSLGLIPPIGGHNSIEPALLIEYRDAFLTYDSSGAVRDWIINRCRRGVQ